MKKKSKKRLIIVSVLLLILFIILPTIGIIYRNKLGKHFLEKELSSQIGATISLSEMDITNDGLVLTDFDISDNSGLYAFKSPLIDLKLDYSSIFNRKSSRFYGIIDSLYIKNPDIAYKQKFVGSSGSSDDDDSDETKTNDSQDSFDFTNYLRIINIENADIDVDIAFKHYFRWTDSFSNANVIFRSKDAIELTADLLDSQENPLIVGVDIVNGGFEELIVDAKGFVPDSIYVQSLDNLHIDVTGRTTYKQFDDGAGSFNSFLTFDNHVNNAGFSLYGMDIDLYDVNVGGNSDTLKIDPKNASFMDMPCDVKGDLLYLFGDQLIDVKAKLIDYQASNKYSFLSGLVSADITVKGELVNPTIRGYVVSPEIVANGIELNRIQSTFRFWDGNFDLQLLNAELNKNVLRGEGSFEKDYFQANLIVNNQIQSPFDIQGNLIAKGMIFDNKPYLKLNIEDFFIGYDGITLPPIDGVVILKDEFLEANLANDEIFIQGNGNLVENKYSAEVEFINHNLENSFTILQKEFLQDINPLLNGKMNVQYSDNSLISDIDIYITGVEDKLYIPLKTDLKWDFSTNILKVSNKTLSAKIFNSKTNLEGSLFLVNGTTLNTKFKINDNIIIKGKDLISSDRSFILEMKKLQLSEIKSNLPESTAKMIPDGYITATLDYKYNSPLVKGDINLTGLSYQKFVGIGLKCAFKGEDSNINISDLTIYNERQILTQATGIVSIDDGYKVNLDGKIANLDLSDYNHIVPITGYMGADYNFIYNSKDLKNNGLRVNGLGSDIDVANFKINDVYFNVLFNDKRIRVDNLYVSSQNYADLGAFGDISYDILHNEYIPSADRLYLKLDTNLYNILKKLSPDLIIDGDLSLTSELIVGISENGLDVSDGYITTNTGFLKLEGQPESFNKLKLDAKIVANMLRIDQFQTQIGSGYLFIDNEVAEENDNFFIGNLILGQFRARTSSRGILINIPDYMAKDESAVVNLSGRYGKSALIKGPFDDMKIEAEALVSNASVIYPPDTENLISLLTSVSKKSFSRKKKNEEEIIDRGALPFTLDSKIIVGENVKYTTYPAKIDVTPNSFLQLEYDNEWTVPKAMFIAEDGYIDFLGNQFTADFVEILINDIKFVISGNFSKRASDGSLISLEISNDDVERNGIQALSLKLESDNPADKTQNDALNRLQYGDEYGNLSEGQRTDYLQNETVLMLGTNIDNTVFNDFLQPVELFVRRRLYLDYFYIRPGFIKNMFNAYLVTDAFNQEEVYYTSELEQFSTSILLNNLSLSLGREVYKRLFFNYTGLFQEATNIQRKSKIIYHQDFELKLNLKFGTKMSYKYKLRPNDENSHEIMILHSISF